MTPFAVLLASLVGSLHCAAMCGGFVAVATSRGSVLASTATYHVARLLGYVGLGALAAFVGASLSSLGAWTLGVQRLAALVVGTLLIGLGGLALCGVSFAPRDKPATITSRDSLARRLRRALRPALHASGPRTGAILGLGSALLPCGWLWGYVGVAAATADVYAGTLVMTMFWLGTLPMLGFVGAFASQIVRRFGRVAPRVTGAFMLVFGVLALLGKLGPALPDHAAHPPERACHHGDVP